MWMQKKDALLGIIVSNYKKCGVPNIANALSMIVKINNINIWTY